MENDFKVEINLIFLSKKKRSNMFIKIHIGFRNKREKKIIDKVISSKICDRNKNVLGQYSTADWF